MSALTKIFVVLLVVLSLVLSAGLIVFVNRQDNYKQAGDKFRKEGILANQAEQAAKSQLQAVSAELAALRTEKDGQIAVIKKDVEAGQGSLAASQTQLADAQQTIASLTAANTAATAALQVAQADIKGRQDAYNGVVADNDKLQKRNVEDENQITALTNSLAVASKHDNYSGEQVTQLQQQVDSLSALLRKFNISPTGNPSPNGGAINTTPNININGVVKDFKNINGVPYATISLGSAEQVTAGMKFNVIDPSANKFLGYLVVDTVQVHESSGHLTGPSVSQVRPNISEVRTQL